MIVPCKDCITFAICKTQFKPPFASHTLQTYNNFNRLSRKCILFERFRNYIMLYTGNARRNKVEQVIKLFSGEQTNEHTM